MASFRLEFEQNGQLQSYPLQGASISIGRDRSADFFLDDPTVSRQHAMITHAPGAGFKLVVLSRGGMTAVDGQQVQGEVPLYDGASLNFGQLSFVFRSPEAQRPSFGGAPAGGGGFGSAPSGGFGSGPAGGGFGSGAPAGGGFGGAPSGGFGGAPAGGGFGGAPAGGGPALGEAPKNNGEMGSSWDDIANSAEALSDAEREQQQATNFQRLEEAAKKAETGTNPLYIVVALIMIVAAVGVMFYEPPSSGGPRDTIGEQDPTKLDLRVDIDCTSQEECKEKALNAFKVGTQLQEKAGANISNPYESWRRFVEAKAYLEKGKVTPPAELAPLDAQIKKQHEVVNAIFREQRVKYFTFKQRTQYKDMAQTLNAIQSYIPDKNAPHHKWALAQERAMRKAGNYPSQP